MRSVSKHNSIQTYWDRSQWPLQALYFLLPLLVIYEIGAVTVLADTRLTANQMLGQFFALFGVTGVHLPAIAARASRHLRVEKQVRKGRTRTRVEVLAGDPRVEEIADMIAGGADEPTALAEAKRLLAD